MNDAQVQQQIQQMVSFIRQEADEKVHELMVKAEEEFNIRKLNAIEEQREKIRAEYARKTKQIHTRRKIADSADLNAARIKVLKERDAILRDVYEETLSRLKARSEQDAVSYRSLLPELLAQAIALVEQEKSVLVIARPQDAEIVKELLPEALDLLKRKKHVEDGDKLNPEMQVQMSTGETLSKSSAGGIIVSSVDGKVRSDNTLQTRLDDAFKKVIPDLRRILFIDVNTGADGINSSR